MHTATYRQTGHEYLRCSSLHVFHICHRQCLKSWFEGRGLMSSVRGRVCVCARTRVQWRTQCGHLHISCGCSSPRALLLSSVWWDPTRLRHLCVCVHVRERIRETRREGEREHHVHLLCEKSRSVGLVGLWASVWLMWRFYKPFFGSIFIINHFVEYKNKTSAFNVSE